MTLEAFLGWIIGGGGATILVRYIVARIKGFQSLSEAERAAISGAASFILIVAGFYGMVKLGYAPEPESAQQWAELIFFYAAEALGLPSIMSTTMRIKYAVQGRGRLNWASIEPDMLFWIRW